MPDPDRTVRAARPGSDLVGQERPCDDREPADDKTLVR